MPAPPCACQIAGAHEFKLDAVINAFVKIEPGEAQLVVRAPLYLFKSARFPVNNVEIDVDKSAPAIERALAGDSAGHHALREWPAAGRVARDRALVAAVGSLFRNLRAGRETRCRAARARHRHLHRPGLRRRADHLSDRLAGLGVLHPHDGRPGTRRLSQARAALHAFRRRRSRDGHHRHLGNGRAQPDVGARRGRLHAASASHTSSPDTIICCSCFAW